MPSIECSSCGESNNPEAKFCTSCGTPLADNVGINKASARSRKRPRFGLYLAGLLVFCALLGGGWWYANNLNLGASGVTTAKNFDSLKPTEKTEFIKTQLGYLGYKITDNSEEMTQSDWRSLNEYRQERGIEQRTGLDKELAIILADEVVEKDEAAWSEASTTDTEKAYLDYLEKTFGIAHREVAQKKADDLAWQSALSQNTEVAFLSYSDKPHASNYSDQAMKLADERAWETAAEIDSTYAYVDYLKKDHAIASRELASIRADETAWEKAQAEKSIEGYITYLNFEFADANKDEASNKIFLALENRLSSDLLRKVSPFWETENNPYRNFRANDILAATNSLNRALRERIRSEYYILNPEKMSDADLTANERASLVERLNLSLPEGEFANVFQISAAMGNCDYLNSKITLLYNSFESCGWQFDSANKFKFNEQTIDFPQLDMLEAITTSFVSKQNRSIVELQTTSGLRWFHADENGSTTELNPCNSNTPLRQLTHISESDVIAFLAMTSEKETAICFVNLKSASVLGPLTMERGIVERMELGFDARWDGPTLNLTTDTRGLGKATISISIKDKTPKINKRVIETEFRKADDVVKDPVCGRNGVYLGGTINNVASGFGVCEWHRGRYGGGATRNRYYIGSFKDGVPLGVGCITDGRNKTTTRGLSQVFCAQFQSNGAMHYTSVFYLGTVKTRFKDRPLFVINGETMKTLDLKFWMHRDGAEKYDFKTCHPNVNRGCDVDYVALGVLEALMQKATGKVANIRCNLSSSECDQMKDVLQESLDIASNFDEHIGSLRTASSRMTYAKTVLPHGLRD